MIAITRGVSPALDRVELTHMERVAIDYEAAVGQHAEYVATLRDLGLTVIELPADAEYPDCVFVEDTAVVFDDIAVITRPGAESRRGETAAVAEVLKRHRKLEWVREPATIDGGDVLPLGNRLFVGVTERTNREGREQLARLSGREVVAVPVNGALHLKTAVTRVSADTVLLNPQWVDPAAFEGWKTIEVDPREPFGGNALLIGDTLVYPRELVHTRHKLEQAGFAVRPVAAGELAKAEGGVTCSSILLR